MSDTILGCLSICLVTSCTLFVSLTCLLPCSQLLASVLLPVHLCPCFMFYCLRAGLYLGPALAALAFCLSHHQRLFFLLISCLRFSSSAFTDQPVQCNLMSLHRELSCILRLKPADRGNKKETAPERLVNKTIAWSFSSGTGNRHSPLPSLHSGISDSLSAL